MPTDSDQMEASRVSIKIPPFWTDRPELWFCQIEAQFDINGVSAESTKFNYLVAQMEARFMDSIYDIIKSDSNNKYTLAKKRLLDTFRETENQRIKHLISGLELGDLRPSQLLLKMKSLGVEISEQVLKTLWLEKMPEAVKQILIVSEEDIEKLASMADKIVELNVRQDVATASVSEEKEINVLRNKVAELEVQIASLTERKNRLRYRCPSKERGNRSQSRKRYNPRGKLCYYHFKFGDKCFASKCQPPCEWEKSGNEEEQ